MSVQSHDCEPSSSPSSSESRPPILPWGDLERNFASLQISIEARLKELEIKEAQVNDRLRELDSREAKIRSHSVPDPDPNRSPGTTEAKKLLSSLSESANEQETLRERVRRALWNCGDPGKLVLEAIGDLYGADYEKRKSVVLLLEQLAEIAPSIGPVERAEAAKLAREWKARIKGEDLDGRSCVSEVLGFLLLIGAYDLVDEFDIGDVFGVFRCIRRPKFRSLGEDSNADSDWGDDDEQGCSIRCSNLPVSPPSTTPSPPEEPLDNESVASTTPNPHKIRGPIIKDQYLEEDLELVHQIASAFTSTFDALKCFCVEMDGKHLKLFLYEYMEEQEHGSWGSKIREALTHAPDPAKLVLDSVSGFLRPQPEFHKSLTITKVRKSCILLLEQLICISPPISQSVGEEALKLAKELGSNLGQRPIVVYEFMLLLAAYRLGSIYDREEILRLLGIASQYKAYFGLCRALGFADEVLIESLIKKTMFLEAVDTVYACGLQHQFQPAHLLKNYLTIYRKRIYKKENQSIVQQKQAINKEITAMKAVIKYIAKYKLELIYPPGGLEKQILLLEIKKDKISNPAELNKPHTDHKSTTVPSSSVPCCESASNIVDSKPETEPSVKEELPANNHAVKAEPDGKSEKVDKAPMTDSNGPSASPWPRLESFCLNLYGKSFNIFSHKIKDEEKKEPPNSTVSSSSSSAPASLWPELNLLCVSMDGKGLRTFVYDHIDEEKNESFRSEVRNALKDVSDPAKLVLDAMPACLRSQNKNLDMSKVRNSRILLLQELITISPLIDPLVREEALKAANELKGYLGSKHKSPGNVFGFLYLVAAYDLVSDFEAHELLGLLGHANQYRLCPDLCRILGFADKAAVVIDNLVQMNLVVEAVEHIYVFEVKNIAASRLLKEYVKSIKVEFDGTIPPSKKAIQQEITALKSVVDCVAKYNLDSEVQAQHLLTRIAELKTKKLTLLDPIKVTASPVQA